MTPSRSPPIEAVRLPARANLLLHQLREFLQLDLVQVRNHPASHAGTGPRQEMVTLAGQYRWCVRRLLAGRPDKKVDEVFATLVNQGRDRAAVHVIQTPPDQRKSLTAE